MNVAAQALKRQSTYSRLDISTHCPCRKPKRFISKPSIATLPSTSHDLVTRSQRDVWELLVQSSLSWRHDIVARTCQIVNASEECFVVCGSPHSDFWEPVGKRDLASIQLLKTIVSDFEFAACSLSQQVCLVSHSGPV